MSPGTIIGSTAVSGANRPVVRAAIVCDRVLREPDGALSIVRIINRVRAQRPRTEEGSISAANFALLLSIGGGAHCAGSHRLRFWTRFPSGATGGAHELEIALPANEADGVNVVLDVRFELREPGAHWLCCALDDEQALACVPLFVELGEGA